VDLLEGKMPGTPSPISVSTRLQQIAERARSHPDCSFTTLSHAIDVRLLRIAFKKTRRDGATGVDGQTSAQYEEDLQANLEELLYRAKAGTYRAPPVRRVHIPKGTGTETRPIGVPTFEDKVLQRAVAMILEAVYEQDFLSCSFGFRPGRSAHQALECLRDASMVVGGGWIVELDVRKFFDSMDHERLMGILRQRVRDGVILRLVRKWLRAGVMEGKQLSFPDSGTPQGGVISPLLANIFLHEVLDRWFLEEVRPRLHDSATLVRYADDAVMVFANEHDARRVLAVLPKRFGRFGLRLHDEKTRLVDFRRPARRGGPPVPVSGSGTTSTRRPQTFDFLGFTHHWKVSRRQKWVVFRRTARDRFTRTLRRLRDWCRQNLHEPIDGQAKALGRKLNGHYAYFGITGNFLALRRLYQQVRGIWRRWLGRRSRDAPMSWEKFLMLEQRYPLPAPRIVHSYISS
jgi:group II intron reverse transcriptase/maturase